MKKRYFLPVLVLVIVFSILFFIKDINGARVEHNLVYAPIEIENGDNLWNIAIEYNNTDYYTHEEYITMVSSINNIDQDKINSGTTLIIPIITTK